MNVVRAQTHSPIYPPHSALPLPRIGSFRTYRTRGTADTNWRSPEHFPQTGSGYLPGGVGPPAPPGPFFARDPIAEAKISRKIVAGHNRS